MTNAEALHAAVVAICAVGGFVGWALVWGGILGDPGDDTRTPRDAEWLDRVPPWLQIVTAGAVVVLIFECIEALSTTSLP